MRRVVMKSDVGRLCDIKSLRELRSLQRENEAAKTAAAGRVKSRSLKVLSLETFFSIENLVKMVKNRF